MRHSAELISAYFDDSLAEGELAQLRAWLSADPRHMREFALEAVIHSRLHDIMLQHDMRGLVFDGAFGDAIDPEHIASLLVEEQAVSAERARQAAEKTRREAAALARPDDLLDRKLMRIEEPRMPRAVIYATLAAAAVLLLMIGRLSGPTSSPNSTHVDSPRQPTDRPTIAVIANTFDAVLRHQDRAIDSGARLQAGPLVVERGVAEVRFSSGVTIVVEAPAELEMMTAEGARLISGRVVVQVPQPALGFTLRSDAATFVDLGTEFGVEIDASRRARMHVLDGEVAFVAKQGANPSRTLRRGLATEVSIDGATREIPFDGTRFVRRVPASAYELAVLKSRPIAYWRLDNLGDNPSIKSEGRFSFSSMVNAGIVAADNRGRGGARPGPDRAARFEGEHDGIDVAGDGTLGIVSDCTYEAWVLAEDTKTGPRRIFSTFDRPRSGMAIGIVDGPWYKLSDDRLKFQLTVYGIYDCLSETPVQLGKWVHLAATVNGEGKPILYVNGVPVASRVRRIEAVAELQANGGDPGAAWTPKGPTPVGRTTGGQARIGRNPVGSDGQISPERWQGQISNVAVYDRVLAADEIHDHFAAPCDTKTRQLAPDGK